MELAMQHFLNNNFVRKDTRVIKSFQCKIVANASQICCKYSINVEIF